MIKRNKFEWRDPNCRQGAQLKKLTIKQQRFVTEYLRDQDAAEAIVRAGYKARHPGSAGNKLLANPAVQAALVDRDRDKFVAMSALRPTLQGARTIKTCSEALFGELKFGELASALSEQAKRVTDENLDRGEAMLAVQAHTLDAIYNNFARRSMNAEFMPQMETFLKLALRAQSQCRATWEAISAIHNPPIAGYVKQANIAQGHQQVNNAPQPSRTGKNQNPQSKLLEHSDDEPCNWMDTRTPETAGRPDSTMETVGEIDGAANSRR